MLPCSDNRAPDDPADPEPGGPRTSRAQHARCSRTPPPPQRKLLQLFPNITLTRSKSQESQLANRVEEPGTPRWVPRPDVLTSSNQCWALQAGLQQPVTAVMEYSSQYSAD